MNKLNEYIQTIGGLVIITTILTIAVASMYLIWGKLDMLFVKVILTEVIIYLLLRVADYFTKD